jgi:hypothetical protein
MFIKWKTRTQRTRLAGNMKQTHKRIKRNLPFTYFSCFFILYLFSSFLLFKQTLYSSLFWNDFPTCFRNLRSWLIPLQATFLFRVWIAVRNYCCRPGLTPGMALCGVGSGISHPTLVDNKLVVNSPSATNC